MDFIRSIDGKFEEYDDSGQLTWTPVTELELMDSGVAIDY